MNTILELENVTGKKNKFSLHNINFALEPGYIYSVIGENGAGKTTLFKYITDEYSKYDGNIILCGKDIKRNYSESMGKVGVLSEEIRFNDDYSCIQNACIFGHLYENFDIELLKKHSENMHLSPGTLYGHLSRGEKMKFQLAFAIAHKSSLYLADEATAGMDPVFRIEFFNILREIMKDENAVVLINSNIMSDVMKQTDYVALMENGRLSEFVESIDADRLFDNKR